MSRRAFPFDPGLLASGLFASALFGLAACAPGGPVETAGADPGAPLAVTTWTPPGPPRAALLAVHGFGDYAETVFLEAAPFWAEAGILVVAYDQRGFGRNPSRGLWPGDDALIDDFAAQARTLRETHPDLPLVALGHSLGAGVVLAAIGEGRAPALDGAILLAPAIGGGEHIHGFMRAGLWAMTLTIPDMRLSGEGVVRIVATDNAEAVRRLRADPLYLAKPTPREMDGLVRIMDRAAAAAPAARLPVLVALGARDEVVENDAVEAVAATLAGPAEVQVYPKGWHLLLNDLYRREVWEGVRDWVLARAS